MPKTLKTLRGRIDRLDARITAFLNARTRLALQIGRIKQRQGDEIYAPDREHAVYRRLRRRNSGPLTTPALEAIYREVMSASLALEKKMAVAFLGPPASFTHLASMKKFGRCVHHEPCDSITECFRQVEQEQADYAVVPIENSNEGAVNHTLDMFIESDLKICSEVILRIRHYLLSKSSRTAIRRIYSNTQALAQCRRWLTTHIGTRAEWLEVSSTAEAARRAAQEPRSAAIASRLAADLYHLDVLASDIQDSANNSTRFLVIGRKSAKPTGHDKTSIVFSVRDRVGALHDMLVPFKRFSINLTKIESRPSKRQAWDYYFFIDLIGHQDNPRVQKALSALERHCRSLKVLGSYPMATTDV